MATKPTRRPATESEKAKRDRFKNVRVLVADRDLRTAALIQRVLFAFGFARIDITTSGEQALDKLNNEHYDLILTEWEMQPMSGLDLVRAVRRAKADKRFRRDIPILMLTARAQKDTVQQARDAGITEFLVKPFSAATISSRLIQVIDSPRVFVDAGDYTGPCRRRRTAPPEGMQERRGARKSKAEILPPNADIRNLLMTSAANLLTEGAIQHAQKELLAAEGDFLVWAKDDLGRLEKAYAQLANKPSDRVAHKELLEAAYDIKSQAGIFGYGLGTQIGGMLVDYLTTHDTLDQSKLTILRKHIDAMSVIFREKIKETGQQIGRELVKSLQLLIEKIG